METAKSYISRIPMWTRKKNSLEDIRFFLGLLGNPDRLVPAIHVAGTNGKGSVCAFLTGCLRQAGLKTATFTSPHLVDLRERFLIGGEPVDEEAFEGAFHTVKAACARMQAAGKYHPTYFEFLFYMAVVLFAGAGVDVMVIETGLGGRLDTTNVLGKPLACVITSIGLDHTQYLGTTMAAIAAEKAGIIKEGIPCIADAGQEEAFRVIRETAREKHAPLYGVSSADYRIDGMQKQGMQVSIRLLTGGRLSLLVPFPAPYQAGNAALAVRVLEVLGQPGGPFERRITDEGIRCGIAGTVWPGRMEEIKPGVFLDGAHNPAGIRAFLEAMCGVTAREKKPVFLLFSAVSDKDYEGMAELLSSFPGFSFVGAAPLQGERGLSGKELKGLLSVFSCPVRVFEDTGEAFGELFRRSKEADGLLFCVGSLYLIGEIRALCNGGFYDRF